MEPVKGCLTCGWFTDDGDMTGAGMVGQSVPLDAEEYGFCRAHKERVKALSHCSCKEWLGWLDMDPAFLSI